MFVERCSVVDRRWCWDEQILACLLFDASNGGAAVRTLGCAAHLGKSGVQVCTTANGGI